MTIFRYRLRDYDSILIVLFGIRLELRYCCIEMQQRYTSLHWIKPLITCSAHISWPQCWPSCWREIEKKWWEGKVDIVSIFINAYKGWMFIDNSTWNTANLVDLHPRCTNMNGYHCTHQQRKHQEHCQTITKNTQEFAKGGRKQCRFVMVNFVNRCDPSTVLPSPLP